VRRAEELADLRHVLGADPPHELAESSEIDQGRLPEPGAPGPGRDDDVRRLQIAMDDADGMGRRESLGEGADDRQRGRDGQGTGAEDLVESRAVDPLEDEERPPVLQGADLQEPCHARAVETRQNPPFGHEPPSERTVLVRGGRDLQDDAASCRGLLGKVARSEGTFAKTADDPVPPENRRSFSQQTRFLS